MSETVAPTTAVIPCGGLGTRLSGAIGDVPKVLAPISGKPFLEHLLHGLRRGGFADAVLLAGVGAEQVAAAARELAPGGLAVRVVVEPSPLGTAGAIGLARDVLPEWFAVTFGDVWVDLDWARLFGAAVERGGIGTVVVHRSSHPEDSDTVAIDDALRVIEWTRRGEYRGSAPRLTNAAVGVFHRSLLERIPRGRPSDLSGELLPALVAERSLFAYTTSEYVCDLGTPARLASVDAAVTAGRARLKAELVLLDRDGVLSKPETVTRPEDLALLPGAARALRALNEAGIRACVVTNQAAVARGLCSAETLEAIHARLRTLLEAEGARLDGIYACPHHPETHHVEGHPALRGPCACRKPSIGLVERALAEQGVVPWRALVVGDTSIDVQLAHNARLACALVGPSAGAGSRDYLARAQWRFDDLPAVAAWVLGAPLP